MNDWPADPELDSRLRRLVDAELAAAQSDGAVPVRGAPRRVGRTRLLSGLGSAGAGAILLVIVAALVLRGTITGPATGPGASDSPAAGSSASPSTESASPPATGQATSHPVEPVSPSPSLALPAGAGRFVPAGSPIGNVGPEVRLADGRVLFIDNPGAEIYDPATGKFTQTGDPAAVHTVGTLTLLADGRVLLAGGYEATTPDVSTESKKAELYDPSTGKFTSTGSMTTGRSGHTATLLADGRVLIAGGGVQHMGVEGDIRRGPIDPRFAGPTATLSMLPTAELYDPKTGTFHATGSMTMGRDGATATRLKDGRVLIAGAGDEGNAANASADLYNPATGTFSATGSMITARYAHNATLLPDGRVLVSAGNDGTGPVTTLEAFDPATGRFADAGTSGGRQFYSVAPLKDGRVLFLGGYTAPLEKTSLDDAACAIYDPATHKLSPAASLGATGNFYVGAVVPLLDGRVLVLETTRTDTTQTTTAELYEP